MNTYHVIVLFALAGLSSCALQVVPIPELRIQGNEDSLPIPFSSFTCAVRPPQFTVIWFYAGQALTSMEKYSITTNASVYNETVYGSVLLIQQLSYTDMGNYTCVVQPSSPNGSESYSATIQLILKVKVEVLGSTNITVNATVTSEMELSCEMSQYIHPDGDLWWFKGEQRIDVTQSKYSIVYRDGTKLAQNGGSSVTSSRVSVLRISQLTSSDSGVYTCRLFGTDQSGRINVTVGGSPNPIASSAGPLLLILVTVIPSNVFIIILAIVCVAAIYLCLKKHSTINAGSQSEAYYSTVERPLEPYYSTIDGTVDYTCNTGTTTHEDTAQSVMVGGNQGPSDSAIHIEDCETYVELGLQKVPPFPAEEDDHK